MRSSSSSNRSDSAQWPFAPMMALPAGWACTTRARLARGERKIQRARSIPANRKFFANSTRKMIE